MRMTEVINQQEKRLATLTLAAAVLSGNENKSDVHQFPDLVTVLKSRLARTCEILPQDFNEIISIEESDLKTVQYITAKQAMRIVGKIQELLDQESSAPLLGTRDLSHVRTLLSIIFKWAVEPLIAELELDRPGGSHVQAAAVSHQSSQPRIIDLTDRRLINYLEDLPTIVMGLLNFVFAREEQHPGKIRQTWITTSILSRHAVDLLTPCLITGWATKPVHEAFENNRKEIKMLSIHFISTLPPHDVITALGTILGSRNNTTRLNFPHVFRACGFLLSKQLARPEGIRALCVAVLGEDSDESAPVLDKLEHIAKVLSTVPAASTPQAYFESTVPRVLALLLPAASEKTPSSHKRAAAFTLSRMLSSNFRHNSIVSSVLLPILHGPFLSATSPSGTEESTTLHLLPIDTLHTLESFLLHTDPSPAELSTLLTPIVPELYTLLSMYRANKTADPNIKESMRAMLSTWGRVVTFPDAVAGIWKIVLGFGGNWEINPDGFIVSERPLPQPSISLETAAKLESKSINDDLVDVGSNPFNLRPDPSRFVAFLKGLDRKDVVSEIFVKLLNEYRDLLNETEEQPMRTLLYVQLIVQMQTELSETVLSKPEHVLSFIKNALSLAPKPRPIKPPSKKGLGLNDLRIVQPEDEEEAEVSDSDDEDDELGKSRGTKDEMTVTAISLLLSVLEGNPDLSSHNTPDLSDILSSLEIFSTHTSSAISQLAREARLVLTARTASSSAAGGISATNTKHRTRSETVQDTYQRALKLLQDPIIPVRAHGLQLLRDLVSRHHSPNKQPLNADYTRSRSQDSQQQQQQQQQQLDLDPALIPGILSIFLQSIQDEESYLFLNGVQGLAAMVDGYGKDVLKGMMNVYLTGTGVGGSGLASPSRHTTLSKQELDARIRVGEALNIVVKRCGGALAWYVDVLIPPLLTILRSSHLPVTLRSSTVSILAQCIATNALALDAHAEALWEACIDLIQLESIPAKNDITRAKERENIRSQEEKPTDDDQEEKAATVPEPSSPKINNRRRQPDLMDSDPTTTNSKAPPLRRSALHLVSQILRARIKRVYDAAPSFTSLPQVTMGVRQQYATMSGGEQVAGILMKRASIVLSYVATTDEDGVTRVMANEALELIEQYREAVING